jgi:hypothetical protein
VLSTDGHTKRVGTADGAPDAPADDWDPASTDADRPAASEHVREGGDAPDGTDSDPEDEPYVTAVVLAIYGDSDPTL